MRGRLPGALRTGRRTSPRWEARRRTRSSRPPSGRRIAGRNARVEDSLAGTARTALWTRPRQRRPALRFPRADVDALGLVLVRLTLARGAGERLATPRDLDVREPGRLDRCDVLSLQESAADSGSPDREVLAGGLGDCPVDDDVRELQPPARLQHAPRLAEDGLLVRREVDDAVGDDEVGRRILHGQGLGEAPEVLDLLHPRERHVLTAP